MRRHLLTLGLLALLTAATGCDRDAAANTRATSMTHGGDPARGRTFIRYYGCSSCHTIPGIRGADALVGPPLTRMAGRSYVGGVVRNTPDNMVRWIQNPRAIDPLSAMPNVGVNEQDAKDIASYLYTLQ
jgi:cytochrome c2